MKILHINTHLNHGGASIAMLRLHNSLRQHGYNSHILTAIEKSGSPFIHTLYETKEKIFLYKLQNKFWKNFSKLQQDDESFVFSFNFTKNKILDKINEIDPDIVHLHWIGNNFFRIEDISKIKAKIIWTLHDMWGICGAEHISLNNRWREGYNTNNRPVGAKHFDLNKWTWNRKKTSWKDLSVKIVTPSSWLTSCVAESSLFKNNINAKVLTINNGINTDKFIPRDKQLSRLHFNLNSTKKILLFGAFCNSSLLKGRKLLTNALSVLDKEYTKKLQIVTFGKGIFSIKGFDIRNIGYINNEDEMSILYSAADATIVPSKIESFGQVAAESLSCGIPVIAFNCTGLMDVVDHKKNGFLAIPYSSNSLSEGIKWTINHHETLAENAQKKASLSFNLINSTNKYISEYNNSLS